MRLGQQNRRPCPYFFCSAILITYATKRHYEDPDDQMIEMIPTHEIRNDNLRPDTCPASLMSFPLDQEMINLLHAMERTHYNELLEKARRENREPPRMPFLEPPPSGSQSMLPKPGSHRFGRTPATEEDEPDWQLGGRQGFEVSGTPKPGQPIPPSTGGHPMTGRRGMSNADVQAQIYAANAEANGAIGALTEANDPSILAAISHVEEALDKTGNAYGGLEAARQGIGSANEQVSESLSGVIAEYSRIMEEVQRTRAALQLIKEGLQAAHAAIAANISEIAGQVEIAGAFSDGLNR
jgi:hypothetical protein